MGVPWEGEGQIESQDARRFQLLRLFDPGYAVTGPVVSGIQVEAIAGEIDVNVPAGKQRPARPDRIVPQGRSLQFLQGSDPGRIDYLDRPAQVFLIGPFEIGFRRTEPPQNDIHSRIRSIQETEFEIAGGM